jgi:hypothetical protein
VNVIFVPSPVLPVWVYGMLAHAASWRSWIFVVALPALGMLGRLLAEWQRRETLVALMEHAPGGTVIVQERGRGGPAMRVEVGSRARQQVRSRGGR